MHFYLFNPTDKTFTKSFGIVDTRSYPAVILTDSLGCGQGKGVP